MIVSGLCASAAFDFFLEADNWGMMPESLLMAHKSRLLGCDNLALEIVKSDATQTMGKDNLWYKNFIKKFKINAAQKKIYENNGDLYFNEKEAEKAGLINLKIVKK